MNICMQSVKRQSRILKQDFRPMLLYLI